MGCVYSSVAKEEDDFEHEHVVSLTSTTYGLLSLDPLPSSPMTPPTPPPRFALAPEPGDHDRDRDPEIINCWELMAGLDKNTNLNLDASFRFSPSSYSKRSTPTVVSKEYDSENVNPNIAKPNRDSSFRFDKDTNLNRDFSFRFSKPSSPTLVSKARVTRNVDHNIAKPKNYNCLLEDFPKICPPGGENKVVLYTTSIRGVRNTFDACNAVRSALKSLGVSFCERDISMDRRFLLDLQGLFTNTDFHLPPRLFIKGCYVGSADEVLRFHDQGHLALLLQGLPTLPLGTAVPCHGCGDSRFLPCFRCHGSCKLFHDARSRSRMPVVTRCPDCNENGLVLCPICS